MESIKKISFELFPEIQVDMDSNDWDVIEERCDRDEQRKAFVKGANYVLEVVESILEDKELDVEETYNKIYATIKQLKK